MIGIRLAGLKARDRQLKSLRAGVKTPGLNEKGRAYDLLKARDTANEAGGRDYA